MANPQETLFFGDAFANLGEEEKARLDQEVLRRKLLDQAKQFGKGALETSVVFPWQLMTGISAIPDWLGGGVNGAPATPEDVQIEEPSGPSERTKFLIDRTKKAQETADWISQKVFGEVDKPKDFGEKSAAAIGKAISPSLPFTAAMAGADVASQYLTSSAEAKDDPKIKAVLEQKARSLGVSFETPQFTPKFELQTQGGPTDVSADTIRDLGIFGAATLGFAFAPSLVRGLSALRPTRFKALPDAPAGLESAATSGDYLRTTILGPQFGLANYARKVGVPEAEVSAFLQKYQTQTSGQALNLIDSAIVNGKFETPGYSFHVPVPVSKVGALEKRSTVGPTSPVAGTTNPVSDYLHLSDTIKDINKGRAIVRGYDLPTSQADLATLRAAYPSLPRVQKAVQDINKASFNFQADGEYAMLTPAKHTQMLADELDTIPFSGARVFGNPVDRGFASDALAQDVRTRIFQQMRYNAQGEFIDMLRRHSPQSIKWVTGSEKKANPQWGDKIVEQYRKGKIEYWAMPPEVADTLRIDPFFLPGAGGQIINTMKNMYTSSLTGTLAPAFALTNFFRSYQNALFTTPVGRRAPGLLSMSLAVPRQLGPQLGKWVEHSLDSGWLGSVLPPTVKTSLSQNLGTTLAKTLHAELEAAGSYRGSYMQKTYGEQFDYLNKLSQAVPGPLQTFWSGYSKVLQSMHNAAEFSYVSKNRSKAPLTQLATEARDLVGSPQITGQFYTKGERAIRGGNAVTKPLAYGAELGRKTVPFWNATVSGMRKVGQSYWKNPVRFTAKAYAYGVTPAVMRWAYVNSLGSDSNGVDYGDYDRNGRSEYDRLMNWYIPIPGRPASEGVRLPKLFHELSFVGSLTDTFLDHAMRKSKWAKSEDYENLLKEYLSAIVPDPRSATPVAQGVALVANKLPPFGPFEGPRDIKDPKAFDEVSYKGKSKAGAAIAEEKMGAPLPSFTTNDPAVGLSGRTQTLMQGFAPVLGGMVGTFATVMGASEKESAYEAATNAIKAVGRSQAQRAPGLRELLGEQAPRTGGTRVMDWFWKKRSALSNVRKVVGKNLPKEASPEFAALANKIYEKFILDAPTKAGEGQGFQSMLRYIDHDTKVIQEIRRIESSPVTWASRMKERPEFVSELKRNGVNVDNPTDVRNFLEKRRQDHLWTIKSVVDKAEAELGVKLEDVKVF